MVRKEFGAKNKRRENKKNRRKIKREGKEVRLGGLFVSFCTGCHVGKDEK